MNQDQPNPDTIRGENRESYW